MKQTRTIGRLLRSATALLVIAGLAAAHASAASPRQSGASKDFEHLYNEGLYEEAVRSLGATIATTPNDASLHYWLGRSLYQMHDYTRAMASLERANALDPSRSEYHDWLGKAYGRKAEESNAFSAFSLARKTHREFTEAVRLDPSNLQAQRDLIRYLLNAPGVVGGGEDRAQEQIRALSVVDEVEGELAQAELYVTRKRFDDASEEYQKILQSNPHRLGVDYEIAEYYRDREDGKRMEEAVDAAAALSPSDFRLDYYRGVYLVLTKKDAVEAEKRLRTYIDAVPNNSELPPLASAHEWLGRLYEDQRRPDKAAEQYQAGLTLDPRNKNLREDLKRVQRK